MSQIAAPPGSIPPAPHARDGRAIVNDLALDVAHVSKTYRARLLGRRGGVRALRGVSMRVHRGEIFGLLGPNGAGKSTLVKILMTIIRPTSCDGRLLGDPIGRKATLGRVGYLPEHHRFPDYLTGAQVLDYYAALANVPRGARRRRSGELIDLVGLTGWERRRVRGYSKGMRQRLGIANALMNDPDLVVLDEPTDGVDPVGRRDIRAVLLRLKDQGKTVFLNSHLLSELEMVCDRVAILVKGVVSAQGAIDELTADSRRYEIELAPARGETLPPDPSRVAAALGGIARLPATDETRLPADAPPMAVITLRGTLGAAGQTAISVDARGITVATDQAEDVQPLLDALRANGLVIRAVRPMRASLEDLFMRAVTDPATGEALPPGAAQNGGGH